jgi:glycosyltransferase involved in cell wall biosynthesis
VSERPLVSVVIPAFNAEAYLGEAIESVLAQTYEPVEPIVVDDGSSDGSAEIAARYSGVTLLRQENRGLSAARNAGVAASSGELLAFNDADDAMLPERLRIQVDHLVGNPEVGCVLASQELVVEPGAELPFWARGSEKPIFAGIDDIDISDTPDIYPVTMLMSRQLFDSVDGFDESMHGGGEDVDILFKLMERDVPIARLKDIVVRRRVHAKSMTQDREASAKAIVQIFKHRIDRRRGQRA